MVIIRPGGSLPRAACGPLVGARLARLRRLALLARPVLPRRAAIATLGLTKPGMRAAAGVAFGAELARSRIVVGLTVDDVRRELIAISGEPAGGPGHSIDLQA